MDKEFWNYDIEEMGDYDLPAVVNYILSVTGQDKLSIVGYSSGATVGFYTLATNRFLQDKVAIFVALAPIITLQNTKEAYFQTMADSEYFIWFLKN